MRTQTDPQTDRPTRSSAETPQTLFRWSSGNPSPRAQPGRRVKLLRGHRPRAHQRDRQTH